MALHGARAERSKLELQVQQLIRQAAANEEEMRSGLKAAFQAASAAERTVRCPSPAVGGAS